MTVLILSFSVVVLVSFFCSLAEATYLSLNPIRAETLRQQGRRNAEVTYVLKKKINRTIATILILNTIANTGGAALTGGAFDHVFGDEWLWLFSLVFTLVVLFASEIVPKMLGVVYSEQIAPWLSPVILFFSRVLRPLIATTEALTRAIQGNRSTTATFSAADIATVARMLRQDRLIDEQQEHIITKTTLLGDRIVGALMTPRERISFLRLDATPEENSRTAQHTLHTRYPVAENASLDTVLGYVNYKEVMSPPAGQEADKLRPFVRPLITVAPDMKADDLLSLLIRRRAHMALIKTTDGTVTGLITLEDLLEEIVGDIKDEFDWVSSDIVELSPGAWRVGGAASMDQLANTVQIQLSARERKETVHDWLFRRLRGGVRGEMFYDYQGTKFFIQKILRKHILEVRVEGPAA